MDRNRIGVLAGLVGVFGLVIQSVPDIILGRGIDRGFEGAIPMIGSVGQTVTVYNDMGRIVGPLVTLAMAVGLGLYVARRVDLSTEYRRVGGAIAIGSTIGVLVAAVPILLQMSGITSMNLITGIILVATVVRMLVEVALLITIGAIAGGAIVTFRTDEERPVTPTGADDSLSTSPSGSTQEDSRPESQPAH